MIDDDRHQTLQTILLSDTFATRSHPYEAVTGVHSDKNEIEDKAEKKTDDFAVHDRKKRRGLP
jgi:hypothetical protein